jgi:hypothetical protein
MKIVLDCVVKDKDKYAAYIQLHDKEGKIISKALVHYEEGNDVQLKQVSTNAFRTKILEQLNKEAKLLEIKTAVESVLAGIDVETEINAKEAK